MLGIKHLYLIGPGGVGKTSVGPIIADLLGFAFIDLDDAFCQRLGNIGVHIRNYGYENYVRANSQLFSELLSAQSTRAVIVLSSGFLATDVLPETVVHNREMVKQSGTSVLLLPTADHNEAAQIVAARQITRGFGLNPKTEISKYLSRVQLYQDFADEQVISKQSPPIIAHQIYQHFVSIL